MNLLFFLTPKATCCYLYADYTLRQAMERMEHSGYSALPILTREGTYCGTLTEGDLLWATKKLCCMDFRDTEEHSIMEIAHRRDNLPVSVSTDMQDLLVKATDQNFVPVVDGKGGLYRDRHPPRHHALFSGADARSLHPAPGEWNFITNPSPRGLKIGLPKKGGGFITPRT